MSSDAAGRLAAVLERRGLTVPGRLLIDAHRPLAPLLSDLSAALGPLLAPLGGRLGVELAQTLEDPGGLDALVEELEPRPRRGPRAESR